MLSLARWIQPLWVSSLMLGLVVAPAAQEPAQEPAEPQPNAQSSQEQQPPKQAAEPDKAVVEQVKPLYALVNEAMKSEAGGASAWNVDPSGKQPPTAATAPPQPTLKADFLRASDNQIYVPFQLTLDSQTVSSPAVAVYVRAAPKGQTPGAAQPDAGEEGEQPQGQDADLGAKDADATKFPFEDWYVGTVKQLGAKEPTVLTGYALLPAGSYDLYVALRERASDGAKPFQAIVVKQPLEVPNYFGGELTTSSVLLVKTIQQLPADATPEQQHENPYSWGRNQLVMAPDGVFGTTDEFNLLLFVYNFGKDQGQKPDITVEYQLFAKDGEAEKEFRKIEPQTYDASTTAEASDLLAVTLSFAVKALKEGDFRLVIEVTDNTSGKSLTRDAPFKVAAS